MAAIVANICADINQNVYPLENSSYEFCFRWLKSSLRHGSIASQLEAPRGRFSLLHEISLITKAPIGSCNARESIYKRPERGDQPFCHGTVFGPSRIERN